MEKFKGFPARMQFTPIPNLFFSHLLPQITDPAEIKTILHLFRALYQKRGYPRFITYHELAGDSSLMSSLKSEDQPPDEALRRSLEMAVRRGTILNLALVANGMKEEVYFLNTEAERRVVEKIRNGEMAITGLKAGGQPYSEAEAEPVPDIFTLYEQNIGLLTPMIAEELRAAEKLYPEAWIRDAIKEAVNQNIRKKSYILAILERWAAEGKSDGAYKRDSKKADPDKYIKGKYGHMVKR